MSQDVALTLIGIEEMSFFGDKTRPEDDWPFNDPPNVAVITTRQVIIDDLPILYVRHDEEDGGWQFHTGGTVTESDAKVVSLQEIVILDDSIKQLADLLLGWIAVRDRAGADWQRAEAEQPAT